MQHPRSRNRYFKDVINAPRGYPSNNQQANRFAKSLPKHQQRGVVGLDSLAFKSGGSRKVAGEAAAEQSKPQSELEKALQLPIVRYKAAIVRAVKENRFAVIAAKTGTGKSTMIPLFLREEALADQILVVNPRRTPCVQLAHRVATLLDSPLGTEVGFRHGLESNCSAEAEIIYTTAGYQKRRELNGTDKGSRVVIIDEYHEKRTDMTLLIGQLLMKIDQGEDIKVVITSATMDLKSLHNKLERFGHSLGVVDIPAKHYPIEFKRAAADAPMVGQILQSGGSLSFFYGKKPIGAVAEQVAAANPDLNVLVYHGELPMSEQQEAVSRAAKGDFAMLATDAAGSSLTIPGVVEVNSDGFKRVQMVGPDGERCLQVVPATQFEELQRAGRTGRQGPGTYTYFGAIPFEKLAKEPAPEIATQPLEAEVLSLLVHGISFKTMQYYLLDQMPPQEIERSLQVLKNLGLITASHNVTDLGRAVEPLPGELRSRIVVALAESIQKAYGYRPAEFLLSAIDMAAVVDAQGIVTREAEGEEFLCGAGRVPRHGRWVDLMNPNRASDPLAQVRLFQKLMDLPVYQFAEWGVHVNQYQRALDFRKQMCMRLDIEPDLRAKWLSKDDTALLRECYWLGNIDRLYQCVGREGKRSFYKPVIRSGPGFERLLAKDSLLKAPDFLVGQPVTIDTEPLDDNPVRLITLADKVELEWLEDLAEGTRANSDWLKTDPLPEVRKRIRNALR
jgi:hypothetical protein